MSKPLLGSKKINTEEDCSSPQFPMVIPSLYGLHATEYNICHATIVVIQTGRPTKKQTTPHDGIAGAGVGNKVELSIQLTAFPHPEFKWWRVTNGSADQEVSGDEFTVTTTGGSSTLVVKSLTEKHFGYYKVTAFNGHGSLTDTDGTDGIVFEVVPSSKCDYIYDHISCICCVKGASVIACIACCVSKACTKCLSLASLSQLLDEKARYQACVL